MEHSISYHSSHWPGEKKRKNALSATLYTLCFQPHLFPKTFKSLLCVTSGVVRGRASGGTHPGALTLGAHQHTFCSHYKNAFLSRNLAKICLKMRIFAKKIYKNCCSVRKSAPEPLPHPLAANPAYSYNFVEFTF